MYIINILAVSLITLCLHLLVSGCGQCNGAGHDDRCKADTTVTYDTIVADVLFAGDFMQHSPQFNSALARGGGQRYDYSDCFALMQPLVQRADLAIGNLEVPLGGRPYSGYPCFSAPDEYLHAILEAGIDVITTANNHCLDRRSAGLRRTIQILDSLGVPHCGTYTSQEQRDENYPLVVQANGIRLALLTFTYGTNGIRNEAPNIVNLIDTAEIAADISRAKTMQPDAIIAIPHWGVEYVTAENAEQRQLADWLLRHGVDHVVGGHPHVVQPYYTVRGDGFDLKTHVGIGTEADDSHLVAYSLGNVISNMSKEVTNGGMLLTMRLQKVMRTTTVTSQTAPCDTLDVALETMGTRLVDVTPELIFNSRPLHNDIKCYRVVPESAPDSTLTPTERTARRAFYTLGHKVIGKAETVRCNIN